ncbi:MAG: hypothetical protein ACD_21C00066G0005 [uncultured bacterium]|nr:MAG: hypothetical protein ACD_21C00066G0005 [uncultured bacterium]
MLIKLIIIALFLFIFYSLGRALYFLVRDPEQSTRVVRALSWRIGLSIALFVFLMIAFALGWVTPNH